MKKIYDEILVLLRDDARLSANAMANMLGISESEVISAVEEMEKSGVIVKYTAIVNDEATNTDNVEALIEVKVAPQKLKGFESYAEEIYSFKEVSPSMFY